MDRPRPKSTSPVPAAAIRKSNSSSSVLEDILRRKGRSSSASVGYGLADIYRKSPDNCPPNLLAPIRIPTPDQGAAAAVERVRSPLVPTPLPLAKSASAPPDNRAWCLEEAVAATTAADAVAWEHATTRATQEEVDGWECQGCGWTDPSCLEPGADGGVACNRCGAVSSGKMVSSDRQKNCAKEDDPTRTGEANDRDPRTAAMHAWVNGPESASARRQREVHALGGTRMPRGIIAKHDLAAAQGRVETQQTRDAREVIEGDSRDARKRRAILIVVEQVINQSLHSAHPDILRHIRREANRIYSASVTHRSHCGVTSCQMSLSERSNALVGVCVVQSVLENLCNASSSASPVTTMATLDSISADVTTMQLEQMLASVKELNLTHSGSVQRLSIAAAIGIISRWTEKQICKSCKPPEPPPPALLRMPASTNSTPESTHSGIAADPGDLTFKLRDRVVVFEQATFTPANVRNQVLVSLRCPKVLKFLTEARQPVGPSAPQSGDAMWPVDALAVALLAATAKIKKKDDTTGAIFDTVCATHKLAPVALSNFIDELQPILNAATVSPELGVAIF